MMAKKSKVNPELARAMAGKGGSRKSPYSEKDKSVKGSRKANISKGGMIKGKANREKYLKEI